MRRLLLPISSVLLLFFTNAPIVFPADQVSARRAMDVTLPDLKFDNISISDAIDFLRDVSGANIHVNWRAIEEIGIGRDTTINVRLRTVQMRKVLRLILTEVSSGNLLTYYIDGNVVEITTRELADKQLFTKVYPIEDLLMEVPDFDQPPQFNIMTSGGGGRGGGGGSGNLFGNTNQTGTGQNTRAQRAQQLVDVIQAIIQPEVWNTAGGPAAIRFWNSTLIVTAPRSVHEQLGGYVE